MDKFSSYPGSRWTITLIGESLGKKMAESYWGNYTDDINRSSYPKKVLGLGFCMGYLTKSSQQSYKGSTGMLQFYKL